MRLDLASTVVFAAVSYVETKLDIRLMKAQVGLGITMIYHIAFGLLTSPPPPALS